MEGFCLTSYATLFRQRDDIIPKIIALFSLLFALSGCQLGPCYAPPCVDAPDQWKTEQSCTDSGDDQEICCAHWWEIFHDPMLNDLEEEAVSASPTLFAAVERVIQARAIAGVDRAAILPHVSLNPSYSEIDSLFKLYLPPGFSFPGAPLRRDFRVQQFLYTMPFNLSWELDLWGKLRGQYASARLNAQAQVEALRAVWLSLTTDLASSYFELRSLDSQIVLLQQTVELRQRAMALAQSRYAKGLASYADVANATLSLANVQSTLIDTERLRALQENVIALLIGRPATDFCLASLPLFEPPPCIPASLPADVLLQRPDIAQLERTMASQHALIGVAYASFFPSLNLTTTLGFSSPELSQFLSWPSRLFSFGANVGQPIFDGGKNCANLRLAWARFGEADDNYQQQVLVAFREVEDALKNLEQQALQSEALDLSVSAATTVAQLAERRNSNGLVSYIEVIEGEEAQLNAQQAQLNLLGVRYLSTVQLIKALGGCW